MEGKINMNDDHHNSQEEITFQRAQEKLQERNKEIDCLIEITEIVSNRSLTLDEMMPRFVKSIRRSFLFPEYIGVRINFNKKEYTSDFFYETDTKLSCDINYRSEQVGLLEVDFLKKNFDKEEAALVNHFKRKAKFVDTVGKGIERTVVRLLTESQLVQSESLFRNLFETMAQGVVFHDKVGKIVRANSAAEKILGLSLERMQGLKSTDPRWRSIHEDGTPFPGEEHPAMVVLRTGKPVYGQVMGIYHPIKEKYNWIKINAVPISDRGEDDPYQVYASFEDVTYEYEAKQKLQKSEEVAKRANKAKSEFLATMSHELRTPLNGIIGFSEILKGTELSGIQKEFLEIILQSGKNLLGIISDILDLSKIESNKIELLYEKTDIIKLVQNTLELIQCKADEKSLKIEKVVEPGLPPLIKVDSLRFKQVLLNLLTNAIKFTDQGSVTLMVKKKWINEEKRKVKLYISVKDTGIGIKEEHQKLIFDAFRQVDMSITRNFGGTGLGLAISKQLLHKMGTVLELESTPGKGSQFYFEIELDYYENESTQGKTETINATSKGITIPNLTGKNILIAEDDPINMKLIRTVLKRFSRGLNLIEAKNGKEACEIFQKYKPDLILMDIVMPELDGYQAARSIRKLDGQTPIIAMTANALKEDKERSLSSGMNDYISKPFSLNQLKEVLIKYL